MHGASLGLQPLRELRLQPLGVRRRERAEYAAPLRGNVCAHLRLRTEHVMLEQRPPRLAHRWRQLTDVENRVQQAVVTGDTAECCAARVPPVVYEHVEGIERFDVVPPERRNEERVAGPELGGARVCERLAKAR